MGTVQFGTDYGISNSSGQVSKQEVSKILNYCRQNDIKVLDTASGYGNAEQVLGEFDLIDFKVISKFLPNGDIKEFDRQLGNTLENLKLQQIYGYLAHRPERLIDNRWEWEALKKAKEEKKIEKIGFSLNSPKELDSLLELNLVPDLVQVPYNYLDRRFEGHLKQLKIEQVEIHTRSVFLQGLFFTDLNKLSNHFDSVIPFLKILKKVPKLSGQLLDFVLSKDFIDKVIIGTQSLTQLQTNIEQVINLKGESLPQPPSLSDSILMPMFWPSNK
ncbi:aldo/keto reductase [Shivajiella indica]|uniref:Aldo/keto reductase n=1 Tax=Shivajiella indica TaxID=872115 RepID=A0ABW5B929_9BACT